MVGSKRMRRPGLVAFSVFLLTCMAGTVSGFAATGPADSLLLTAGSASVPACQTAPLRVSFAAAYDPGLGEYGVTAVIVSGLDTGAPATCAGKHFQVTVADDQGNALSETSGTVPMSGAAFVGDLAGVSVRASAVASVSVTISG